MLLRKLKLNKPFPLLCMQLTLGGHFAPKKSALVSRNIHLSTLVVTWAKRVLSNLKDDEHL